MDTKTIVAPAAYRQLSDAEIKLVNEINAHREQTRELVGKVASFVAARDLDSTIEESDPVHPGRAVAIGRTDLQAGFMWLARAVAQPSFF